jgi:hypothetical protein
LRYYREKNNKYQNHINHLITNKELSVKKKQNLLNRKKNKKLIYLNKTKSIQQKMKSIKR